MLMIFLLPIIKILLNIEQYLKENNRYVSEWIARKSNKWTFLVKIKSDVTDIWINMNDIETIHI